MILAFIKPPFLHGVVIAVMIIIQLCIRWISTYLNTALYTCGIAAGILCRIGQRIRTLFFHIYTAFSFHAFAYIPVIIITRLIARFLKASIFKHSDRRAALQIDLRRCRINDIDLALHCFLIFIIGIGQRIGPQFLRIQISLYLYLITVIGETKPCPDPWILKAGIHFHLHRLCTV